MLNNTFTYNGHTSDEFGINIERRPDLSRSARKFKSASVPGRNGDIYQLENAWEEVVVAYDIFAGGSTEGDAISSFTDIVEWLNSADDYCVLTDTYDPTHYRLGIFVDAIDIQSAWYQHGKATVRFRCRPQRFIVEDPVSVTSGDVITNNTNHVAHPIITLTGSGPGSLLDMNRTMNTSLVHPQTLGQMATLINAVGTNQVFWARPSSTSKIDFVGHNVTVGTLTSITNSTGSIEFNPSGTYGIGMIYFVNPSSTYTLSLNVNRANCKVGIFLGGSSSPSTIQSYMEYPLTNGSNQITFTTFTNTGVAAFIFYGEQGSSTTYSSIMLNNGSTANPFSPYSTPYLMQVQINDIDLQFLSDGFHDAVIDCERENFTLEGNNANNLVTVSQNGGLSVNYLQLEKGSNTITFDNSITSMTIEKRLWEL